MLIITQSEYILNILNELSYVSDFTTMIDTLSKFWVSHKKNGTKVFMLKMWSHIYVKMIFNDFEIICWEILELFTAKVD